jgi:hypothetical protein
VPIFQLLPPVTLKKRLDVEGVARRGAARLPGMVLLAWRDELALSPRYTGQDNRRA